MNRRHLILSAAAALALPRLAHAATAPLDYKPGLEKELLAQGKTVFLDFKADWCSTCKAQERVLTKLKAANPAYAQAITFVNVDWDAYGKSEIVQQMKIPRRSTLLVLKGDQELGRLVAQTGEAEIKTLLDTALAASA